MRTQDVVCALLAVPLRALYSVCRNRGQFIIQLPRSSIVLAVSHCLFSCVFFRLTGSFDTCLFRFHTDSLLLSHLLRLHFFLIRLNFRSFFFLPSPSSVRLQLRLLSFSPAPSMCDQSFFCFFLVYIVRQRPSRLLCSRCKFYIFTGVVCGVCVS